MSIRSILRAALAGFARFVVVTTETVVNGIRVFVTSLVPAWNTAQHDAAEAALVEEQADEALDALKSARAARSHVRPSEPERVRRAATELREGRSIGPFLLDPRSRPRSRY